MSGAKPRKWVHQNQVFGHFVQEVRPKVVTFDNILQVSFTLPARGQIF